MWHVLFENYGRAICDSSHTYILSFANAHTGPITCTVCAHLHFSILIIIFSFLRFGLQLRLYGYMAKDICLKGNKTCANRYRSVDYYAFSFFFFGSLFLAHSCPLHSCTNDFITFTIFSRSKLCWYCCSPLDHQIVKWMNDGILPVFGWYYFNQMEKIGRTDKRTKGMKEKWNGWKLKRKRKFSYNKSWNEHDMVH